MQNNIQTAHLNVAVNTATTAIGNFKLPNITATESPGLKAMPAMHSQVPHKTSLYTISNTNEISSGNFLLIPRAHQTSTDNPSAPLEPTVPSTTVPTPGLVEGIYMTPNKVKVELSFKVHNSVIGERDLPSGKVHLRIGNARVMIVDAKDVAGMGLTMVREGVKKRLTEIEKSEAREMRREESRVKMPRARKVLLDERRRKVEGVENDAQKMVREWKEKRRRIKVNGKGGVNGGYFGGTCATTGIVIA
ncbi:hypothetical protein BZA77DRAFT_372696 [Pyronema omphalodes]|nr:hypothetical protein BZA77DRAFT_372696 [Pyronema omphalodes]